MPDTKISAMPSAATLDGTELTPIVQTGVNKQVTTGNYVSQVLDVTPVKVSQGGTNATTAAGARTNLAAAYNLITLTAGTGLSGGGDLTANRSFAIANTGVTAATYGSSTKIPVVTFNAQGQATSASEVTLSPASIGAKFGAFHYDYTTTLTANINSNSTAPIAVASTTGFSTSGAFIVGNEIIAYTGKTATTFTGITRGAFGSSGASHSSGDAVGGAQGTTANTATLLQINTTDLSSGVTLTASSELQFAATGTYSITFSVQTTNAGNAPDNFTIWARLNGSDVASTASVATTPASHSNIPGAGIVTVNLFLSITAGDKLQLFWATDSGDTVVTTYPPSASPAHPASPAVIITANQIA